MARSVLVTGATGGIGGAILEDLLDHGYHVLATARRREDREALEARGCAPVPLELTDRSSLEDAAGRASKLATDGLHGVVHNAGLGVPGAVAELTAEAWQHQFAVNLFGHMELTRLLLPAVRESQGRFVFLSSQAALITLPLYGAYCASKQALEAAVDALRMEVAGQGVGVSLVEPGPVRTGFQARSGELHRRFSRQEGQRGDLGAHLEDRLVDRGGVVPASRVSRAVLRALTSRRPRPRYVVGRLSWMGTVAARAMPTSLRDAVLRWWLDA